MLHYKNQGNSLTLYKIGESEWNVRFYNDTSNDEK